MLHGIMQDTFGQFNSLSSTSVTLPLPLQSASLPPSASHVPKCCMAFTKVELGALTKMAKDIMSMKTLGPRHSSMVWKRAGKIDS